MMLLRTRLSGFTDDLVHQQCPPMTAITNTARNSAQPAFKSDAQRLRKKNRRVEKPLASDGSNNRKKRTVRQPKNCIYFRNELPNRCNLYRRCDSHMSVRAPLLN